MSVKRVQIYVSPNGSDANDGTFESPLATFAAAKQKVKRYKTPTTQVSVVFRGGNYFLDHSLVFSSDDGGTPDAPVIYKAYKNEKPVFIGAKKIPNERFKKVTDEEFLSRLIDKKARNKVYCAEIPELADILTPLDFGSNYALPLEVFEGERAMDCARYPKRDLNNKAGFGNYATIVRYHYTKTEKQIFFDDETVKRMQKWSDEGMKNAAIEGYFAHNWHSDKINAMKINRKRGFISATGRMAYTPKPDVETKKRAFIFNIPDELSQAGEYYIDRDKCIFYFIPSKPIAKEEIYINAMSGAMFYFGTRCADIQFKGLTMKYTRADFIEMCEAKNILFDGLEIAHGSKKAINMRAVGNITIRNSHIYDLGAGGILSELSGGNALVYSANILIENNDIHDVARIQHCYSGAVNVGWQTCGVIIRNNKFHSSPHLLVGITNSNDVLIENNEFYDAVRDVDDAGVIYWGRASVFLGLVIRNNYFHDCGNNDATWGISCLYADDAAVGADIYNNIFADTVGTETKKEFTVVKAHPESFSHIHNNIFVGKARIHSIGTWDYANNSGLTDFYPNVLGAMGKIADDRFFGLCTFGFFNEYWKQHYNGTIWEDMWKLITAERVARIQTYREELEKEGLPPEIVNGRAVLLADEITWNHKTVDGKIYEGNYWDYVKTELKDVYDSAVAEVEGKGEKALLDRLHLLTRENYWFHRLVADNTVKTYGNVCVGIAPEFIDENGKQNLGYYRADSELVFLEDKLNGKSLFKDAENGNYELTEEASEYIARMLPGFKPFDMTNIGIK